MQNEELLRTPLVPVWQEENKQFFVDPQLIKPRAVTLEGVEVLTSPLKINETFDLLGLAGTQSLLDTGIFDTTDALDPNIVLESIIVEVADSDGKTSVETYSTEFLPTTNFVFASAGNYRTMCLNFDHTFDGVADDKVQVQLAGSVNLELGTCSVVAKPIVADNATGVQYKVIGYTLKASRVNHNRRAALPEPAPIPNVTFWSKFKYFVTNLFQ